MPRFVELSHQIVPGMKTYPGLPEPQVDVVVDYESSRQHYQGQDVRQHTDELVRDDLLPSGQALQLTL